MVYAASGVAIRVLFHKKQHYILIISLFIRILIDGKNGLLQLCSKLLVPLVLELLWDEKSLPLFMEFGQNQ